MKLESPALLHVNDKLMLVIPQSTISPFSKMNKKVDYVMISKEDLLKNEYYIKDIIGESTEFIFI